MTTGLPTLSQIRVWNIEHLIEAAEHWTATADRWDYVYGQVWQQSLGMDWQGKAGDALVDRTTADKAKVTAHSDRLREAAQIARKGAGDISAAQRSVLYKVDDAHQAGFIVGEDLLANDNRVSRNAAEQAARQAQAQAISADIRSRAAQLAATDTEVGANLTGTAGHVGGLTFDEKPITVDGQPYQVRADAQKGTIQLVGHGFKQDGPTPAPAPPPQPPAIKLPPSGPAPVQVITAEPPDPPSAPPRTMTGTPLCPGDKILGHLLEILAGGALVAVSGPAEAPSLGTSTAGLLGGGSLIYNGIDGLETCP